MEHTEHMEHTDHYIRLQAPVLIDVCKDGTISYRLKHGKRGRLNDAALPFYSVESEEEAAELQVALCKLQYTSHPERPGEAWYRFINHHTWVWSGMVGDIERLTALFDEVYWSIRDRKDL
jgi:hypothetical protein